MNKPKFTAEILLNLSGIYSHVVKIDDYNVKVDNLYTLRIVLVDDTLKSEVINGLEWCVVLLWNDNIQKIDYVLTNLIYEETMDNNKFIKMENCNDVKDLFISVDSIECVFSSLWDFIGLKDKSTGDGYNFIQLKSGKIFEIEESPDDIIRLTETSTE